MFQFFSIELKFKCIFKKYKRNNFSLSKRDIFFFNLKVEYHSEIEPKYFYI